MNATEESVFAEAVNKLDPQERAAFLDQACAGDPKLRTSVESLLSAYHAGEFLESAASSVGTIDLPHVAEKPGADIGPFKLLEQIGEGGMGLVFQAEQMHPVRRRVALKIIKPGMDSRQVIARFEAERQALALMEHPNIARVLDAGTTASGRPYFVMELVRGVPITDYCDQHKLTIRQRLELFMQVCQAVQHAHQKGIIHRDLKPNNVLVAHDDTVQVPKVIDFGIAKATGQSLTDSTLFTAISQVVGTPRYMSPEQAALNHHDVDTRSDVYSLGVVLYELLTGTTPFEEDRLRKLGLDEVRRIIQEEEPPRPSTRASTLGENLTTVSQRRGIDPRRMSITLRGELDWIVMMALEKDRRRRYESASAFAADVQRYLNDEPVLACPPSVGYRLRKLATRNKAALATTALLTLMLLAAVGAVAGTIGWGVRNRTALEQEVATDRETRQIQLHKEATTLLDDVERQRAVIHAKLADPIKVCELMSNIDAWHASLGKARAGWQNAKNLTASNADVSTAELAKRLQLLDDDLHADEADWKIAKKLDDIRMFEEAKAVDGHSKSYTVAPIYEQFFRDLTFDWNVSRPAQIASKIQKSRLRYVLVAALDDWGGKSTDNQVQRLETARLADPDPWRDQVRNRKDWNDLQVLERLARDVDPAVQSPHMLANLARAITRKKGDASSLLRAALIHFPQDFWLHFDLGLATQNADQQIGSFQAALAVRPKSVWTHSNLGIAFAKKRDFDGAIQHYRKALELDPKFGGAYGGLGTALLNKKDVDGAIPHLLKAIELLPNEAELHYNLGNALGVMKDGDGAIRHYRKALDLDPNHIGAHNNLGNGLKGKKDFDGAIRHFRKALDLDANLVPAHVNLGAVLVDKKDVDGAIHHFRKALDMDPNNAAVHSLLGSLLQNKKDIEGAIQHFRNAIELEPNLAKTHFHLAVALQNKKDIDGAIRHLRKGLDLEPSDVKAHNYLVSALKGKKDIEGAIQYLRKALDQNSNFAEAHCNLGSCLLETGQFAEALKHYRLGHELGSKQSGWSYPSAIWVQQGERLVKLDQQVPAVLKGDVQPTSPQEWLAYIDVCRKKKAHASALQLWHKLFLKHPSVEANFRTGLRVNAASDAVLASDGRDKDAAEISDANRTTMRTQAYKWLYADLDAYRKLFQEKQPHAVLAIANTLPELQKTRALATVRDEPNLGKLPEEERKPWQKLWTDVEQLRKQTHGMFKEASRLSGMVTAKETKSVHEMKLKAGTTYVIDLESKAFDTFLRLEDAQGKKLVENDDITPGIDLNSRLIFTPPTDGTYRIIASAFNQSGAGAYTLTIREFVK